MTIETSGGSMFYLVRILVFIWILTSCQVKEKDSSGDLVAGHVPTTNSFTVNLPADGSYKEGADLSITLTHPFDVTVTGLPRILLTIDSTDVYATYLSGSGSKNLVFKYTVLAGQNDFDGIEIEPTVDLNGGTIKFNSTVDAETDIEIGSTTDILVDTTSPVINTTNSALPGLYSLNQKIVVTVEFDEKVNVTGTPRIKLDIGGSTKYANYSTGSGTNALSFSYTVASGNKDLDGVEILASELNNGTIKDLAGNSATFSITTGTMTGVLAHDVPTKINSVTTSANKTYLLGQSITFTTTFSRNVTITGTPRISINVGGTNLYASYSSGSGTKNIVFTYTVGASENDSNGIGVTGLISLNGGSILDANNDAVIQLFFVTPNTTLVKVDGALPEISSITPPANGNYVVAQNMNFSVIFSEPVTVTGTPTLDFVAGVTTKSASYLSGSGSSTLVFRYIPISGDEDTDGIALTGLTLTSATIKDASGNDADLSLPVTDTSAINIVGVPPFVSSINPPANGTYLESQTLDFEVVFNTNVDVTGSPRLTIQTTSGNKYASYLSGTGTNTLTFRYTITNGDYDYDGIALSASIDLNSGTIKDSNNYNAVLTLTSTDLSGVKVDASPAIITSVSTPSARTYGEGEVLNFTVIFTKNVNITGTPRITLNIGGVTKYANYQSGTGTKNIVFRKTISTGEADADGIGLTSPIGLNGGTIEDSSNIAATLTYTLPDTSGILVDSTGPQISNVTGPSNDTYVYNENLTFVLDYSEDVVVTGTPRLVLNIGGTNRYANYISGSGTSTLIFRHTILSGDTDSNGITMTTTMDLNSGTIKDLSNNNAGLTFVAPALTGVLVDALLPEVSSLNEPSNGVYANPQNMDFTVVFNKNITVTGTPRLHLTVGASNYYANYISGTGSTSLVFRFSPAISDFDLDGIEVGNSDEIDLNGGTIKDNLNNDANLGLGTPDTSKVYVSYPGMGGWYDVTDDTTITTVFSSPNYQTSNLSDKSGNGRHTSQTTSANRPYYLSSGFGGMNTAYIQNNSTDLLSLASSISNIKFITIVFKTPATIAAAPLFASNTTSVMGITTGGTGRLAFNASAQWKINGGALTGPAATNSPNGSITTNTCYIATAVFNAQQTPATQRLGSSAFLGQYSEFLIYTGSATLTNTELTNIHNYLNSKYACY